MPTWSISSVLKLIKKSCSSLHSLNLELVSSTTSIQMLKSIPWNLTTHIYAHLNPIVKVKAWNMTTHVYAHLNRRVKVKAFPHYSYQFLKSLLILHSSFKPYHFPHRPNLERKVSGLEEKGLRNDAFLWWDLRSTSGLHRVRYN